MSTLIRESFEVAASPGTVWSYLTDPRQVVECLPGAELLEVEAEGTFVGRMRVKVGPVTATFRGKARFEELDETALRVRLSGDGQDAGGAGTARMKMTSQITALPGGRSRVSVESEVEVMGRLAQFGRGLMEEVSRQMFRQFAACAVSRLEAKPVSLPEVASVFGSGAVALTLPAPPTPAPTPPLRALPLLWAALRAWLHRIFDRTG